MINKKVAIKKTILTLGLLFWKRIWSTNRRTTERIIQRNIKHRRREQEKEERKKKALRVLKRVECRSCFMGLKKDVEKMGFVVI